MLDAVDRPHLAAGLPGVSRIVAKAATQISWPTLIKFARRWNESAVVQRLGYLVDLHGVDPSPRTRDGLLALVSPSSKVHFGSRSESGSTGTLNRSWAS